MGAEEDVGVFEPVVEGGVGLEVTEGPVALNADEHTEGLGLFALTSRSVLKTTKVLVDGVVSGEVVGLVEEG
jgi:hypothetical protein